ncbi:MAG: DPP IV N-terminal domain-containing protein [Candidatus Methanoperedens sp.]|nr:DPP IV N-terminal domain-containing protein [Candidatus Methanoperedens sp.]
MKVSYILFYLALLLLFSVPVSADVNIQSSSVIRTNETLILSLDWSPDGNSLAYVAYDDSRRQQIFTINVDGTGKKQVTNDTNKKWSVAWFDDDISFISYDTDGLEKIFLVKPDGSGLRKLLDDKTRQGRAPEDKPPALGGASWNPKTKTVLFTSFDAKGNEKIYQVNIDGTGKKQVITDEFRQWNPEWSPDWNSFQCRWQRQKTDYVRWYQKIRPGLGSGRHRVCFL